MHFKQPKWKVKELYLLSLYLVGTRTLFADAPRPMSQTKLNQFSRKTRKINPRSLMFVYMIKYRNIKYTQNLFCLSLFRWWSRMNARLGERSQVLEIGKSVKKKLDFATEHHWRWLNINVIQKNTLVRKRKETDKAKKKSIFARRARFNEWKM